ncbi:MAG TPA: NUDIX hydrolase [Bacillota bacterium]|nr:NUDIX hydrolase [Bacillota bacterium]
MEPKWLVWAKQLQSIAQAGLTYSKDKYDLERFEMLREISVEMLAEQTNMDKTVIKDLFANETGYQTPKVDVRAVIFKGEKILMVKEEADNLWALPGGWGDIGLTPSEVAVTEVKEEAGLDVKPTKLIGVADKKKHPHPPAPYHSYKIFIQCEIVGGKAEPGMETIDVGFFDQDNLPNLSVNRNTKSQIQLAFKHLYEPDTPAYVD